MAGKETHDYEPQSAGTRVELVSLIEGHAQIGHDVPYDLDTGGRRLAAAYDTHVKSWLSVPGREVYYLTWAEDAGELPEGAQVGEGERRVSIGGTRDEYLLSDPRVRTSVIGIYEPIQFPRDPDEQRMLVYRPGPDEILYHPEDDPSNPYDLYAAARRVHEVVIGETDSDPRKMIPKDINPTTSQTATGIMLHFDLGHPKFLWTPMGSVPVGKYLNFHSHDNSLVQTLDEKGVKLVEFMPQTYTEGAMGGLIGPTYAVESVGEMQLPQARLKSLGDFFPPNAAENTWQKYGRQFARAQKRG